MRRTTRTLTGALLVAGLGLTGCAFGDDEADLDGTGIPAVFQHEEEEVGGHDRVGGEEEVLDSVDRGSGGIRVDGGDEDLDSVDPGTVEGDAGG